jgi:outer membrane protein OmpA-like peptidoglycan-associated protein
MRNAERKTVSIFFSLLIFGITAIAQQHNSCDSAAVVDSVYGPVHATGEADATLAMKHTDGNRFEKPHSVVWFTFQVPYDTILTFDLIPQHATDDIDFLLFKDDNSGKTYKNCNMCRQQDRSFCDKIAYGLKPVRSNLAHTDTSLSGWTGLSATATNTTELPGKHPVYGKALPVKKGERYYLAVDNYTHANGAFTLRLHFHYPKWIETCSEATTGGIKNIAIEVVDSLTLKPVKARIVVSSNKPNDIPAIDTSGVSSEVIPGVQGVQINVKVIAKGYLLQQSSFVLNKKTGDNVLIHLVKIRAHQNLVFRDMEFVGEKAEFLPIAHKSLEALLEFMQSNPEVKILIKGFVNDPGGFWGYKKDMKLSDARAEAVYDYLVKNGIDKDRMTYKGFGNSNMLYPDPLSEEEAQANRRVEVEIK